MDRKILDRKWSPKSTANDPMKNGGMEWISWDWLQKKSFSSRVLKKKGRRTPHHRSIYINRKLFPSSVASIIFQECFVAEKFKTGKILHRKNSIILTPRSSTCLLRNIKPGTLYITRALIIVFTDLFGSVELIFRIFNFDFSLTF